MTEFICEYYGCIYNSGEVLGCQKEYIDVEIEKGEVIECNQLETPEKTCEYCRSELVWNREPMEVWGHPTYRKYLVCRNCGEY